MKIAVCDDEQYFVDNILGRINAHGIKDVQPNIFNGFTDPDEFIESFKMIQYDMVYLDVELNDKNGMRIATEINRIKPDCLIIFVSAYKKYIHISYRVNAFQYLTKPINDKLFDLELERGVKKYKKLNRSVLFQTTAGNKLIKTNNIIYLETFYDKYKLVTTGENYFGKSKTLTEAKKDLINYHFYQLNRSIILNFKNVDTFTNEDIIMINKDILHITKRKRKDFKDKYFDYIDKEE